MRDADDRLGDAIAAIVRASRALAPNHLDGLLENISVEIGAALMEEQARRKAAQAQRGPSPNVLTLRPDRASEAADPRPGAAEEH